MAAKVTTVVGNTGPLYRIGIPQRDGNGVLVTDANGDQVYETIDSNWSCRVYVENGSNTIDRFVTAISSDGFRYLAQLTPAETLTLPAGLHTVAIEVSNPTTTPPFNIEKHELLELIAEEAT